MCESVLDSLNVPISNLEVLVTLEASHKEDCLLLWNLLQTTIDKLGLRLIDSLRVHYSDLPLR
jgi:hypothetical protein